MDPAAVAGSSSKKASTQVGVFLFIANACIQEGKGYHNDMNYPNLSPEINWAGEQLSICIESMLPGQFVRLELAEGSDNERHFSLIARYNGATPRGECPELEVVYSEVPDETIEKNRKCELGNPDFVGEKFIIRGGCNKIRGHHPTLVHIGHIDANRAVWLAFPLPETAEAKSMEYFPWVRGLELLPIQETQEQQP